MVVDVTPVAAEKLKELLKTKETEKYLKLYIAAFGWGGPTFGLALEEPKDNDEIIKTDDFNFVMEKDLIEQYGKFTIDYSDNWLKRGFSVIPDRGGSSCS